MSNTPKAEALQSFLRVYHDTLHSTTKVAPSALIFGHSRTSGIPQTQATHKQQHAAGPDSTHGDQDQRQHDHGRAPGTREDEKLVVFQTLVRSELPRHTNSINKLTHTTGAHHDTSQCDAEGGQQRPRAWPSRRRTMLAVSQGGAVIHRRAHQQDQTSKLTLKRGERRL